MKLISKEKKRALLTRLIPPVGYVLVWLIHLTCKNRFEISKQLPPGPFLIAFWHGELLMQPFLYRQIRKQPRIFVMISEHFDGIIIAKLVAKFGFQTITGSSSRGGKRALLASIRALRDDSDVAITPDGPRGPYRSIADGVIALSQKTGAPIIGFRVKPESYWQLKSWDKFMIPKPFSTIHYRALDPIDLTGLDLDQAKNLISKHLDNDE